MPIIAKILNQPPLSTEGKQFGRLCYAHALEYYAAPKKKKMIIMKTLAENEKSTHGSILSEKSRMPNSSYSVITALYKFLARKDIK